MVGQDCTSMLRIVRARVGTRAAVQQRAVQHAGRGAVTSPVGAAGARELTRRTGSAHRVDHEAGELQQ